MSAEWLELEEQRRREDARLRGVEPTPRYTFGQLVIEAIYGINQADQNVIDGVCEVVESSSPTTRG